MYYLANLQGSWRNLGQFYGLTTEKIQSLLTPPLLML